MTSRTWVQVSAGLMRSTICLVGFGVLILAGLIGIRYWIDAAYGSRVYTDVEQIPAQPAAIVFGAGITRAGQPSPILRDRLNAALSLYRVGKVNKLLLSGDNRFLDYNEPGIMAAYLREQGIPERALVLDYAGRRTYDTCYRAGHIFGVRQAVLVTQNFHMDRALYLCDSLGLDAVGLAADGRRPSVYNWLREIPATAAAWFDVNIRHPMPVMGDLIPVDWGPAPQDQDR